MIDSVQLTSQSMCTNSEQGEAIMCSILTEGITQCISAMLWDILYCVIRHLCFFGRLAIVVNFKKKCVDGCLMDSNIITENYA